MFEPAVIDTLAAHLQSALPGAAKASTIVIAGSGLGGFTRTLQTEQALSYGDLPHVGASTVVGHAGSLLLANVNGKPVVVMNGRRHLYEGISPGESTVLLRAIIAAFPGIRNVVISNAAGGLNPTFEVGDLMLISDHINWTFQNPLIGPNREQWGPRFPDLSQVYSFRLRELARAVALKSGVQLREGVYLAGHGPSYETRAEVAMLRHTFAADAVGMSTVPEALVCAHMDREALGISFISNLLTRPAVTTHEEVMENARKVEGKFAMLVQGLLAEL